MKQIFSPLILAALAGPLSSAAQSSGPIAHWTFNGGSANDTSGNDHHGTLYNVTPALGRDSLINTAFFFSGNDSYISVPYSADWDVSQYTIGAVVKPTAFNTDSCQGNFIISRGPASLGRWALMFTDNMYNDCSTADTSKYLFVTLPAYATFASNTPLQYAPSIRTNSWYTVIATYDGNQARIYVDGILKSAVSYVAGSAPTLDSVIIGREQPGTNYPSPFIGTIDDIQVYNRVLTPGEIQNYSYPLPNGLRSVRKNSEDVTISPNPCQTFLDVKLPKALAEVEVQITNAMGQSVYRSIINGVESRISMESLPPGFYSLQISSDESVWVKKVVKQ